MQVDQKTVYCMLLRKRRGGGEEAFQKVHEVVPADLLAATLPHQVLPIISYRYKPVDHDLGLSNVVYCIIYIQSPVALTLLS